MNILKQFYNLKVIGLIKINEHVYKIKTEDHYYIMKSFVMSNKQDISLFENLESFHIDCFVCILKNKFNDILSYYDGLYYYVMKYIELDYYTFREFKIKSYFEILSYLHLKTLCHKKVNKKYFKNLYLELNEIINSRIMYYESLVKNYETIQYKSPFQWFYVLNYYKIFNALNLSIHYLNEYIKMCETCTSVRICLNYGNFDYHHICIKDKLLISIDHIRYDMPLYDLYNIYQKIPDFMFDLDCFKSDYFNKIEFLEEEYVLLYCLMNIVPIAVFDHDELDNIIKFSRLLYYLDSINEFINSSH